MPDIDHEPSEDLIRATRAGPHKGWETFGIEGEGTLFQMLEDMVGGMSFYADDAEPVIKNLEALIQSFAYGTRDSHLNQLGDIIPDDLEDLFDNAENEEDRHRYAALIANRDEDNGDFADSDYFCEINKSLTAIRSIDFAAAEYVNSAKIFDRLFAAYEAGLKLRDDEAEPSALKM